jgi:hypothetical protein
MTDMALWITSLSVCLDLRGCLSGGGARRARPRSRVGGRRTGGCERNGVGLRSGSISGA